MRLKLHSFGSDCEGIKLEGISFPGGDVEIVRTSDNQYWIHARVNHSGSTSYEPEQPTARLLDGRIDLVSGYPTSEQQSAIQDSRIYHLALRVGTDQENSTK